MDTFRLPSEIPESEWPKPEEFIAEAHRLVTLAAEQNLILRIMGGMAIHLHSLEQEDLWRRLGRLGKKVFTDIDFVAYGKHRIKFLTFFKEAGYTINQTMLYRYGKSRQIYYGPHIPMVEVFYDQLEMNHIIPYKGRLEADSPTLAPAELLLQKLQMVRMNEKDLKDAAILLRSHECAPAEGNIVDTRVLNRVLGADWGFWHTATTNLDRLAAGIEGYDVFSADDRTDVTAKIDQLRGELEQCPKTLKWKSRSLLGTKVSWYNEVDDWDVIEKTDEHGGGEG